MTIKKELKLDLVAKRLAMLQDHHLTHPVLCFENPVHCESTEPPSEISDDFNVSEDFVLSNSSRNRRKNESHKRKRVIISDNESSGDEQIAWTPPRKNTRLSSENSDPSSAKNKPSCLKRAEELQANLSNAYPSFIKLMLKSHVSGGFCLALPSKFCDKHLPVCDTTIVLVDEAGKEYKTVYLANKRGLSAGWRGFSIDHNLVHGDILVFHLIDRSKFRVYIIREQIGDIDGALGLLSLDPIVGQEKSAMKKAEQYIKMLLQTEPDYPSQGSTDIDLGSETLDGIHFSDSTVKFDGVKDFENFNINVDGLILDSKFSETTRKKYYKLCCDQRCVLHQHLLNGLNCNLVVGIISETVNIADGVRSGSTSNENLLIWEETLKGFEFLGMKVAFLCARVKEQLGHTSETNTAEKTVSLRSIVNERADVGKKWKVLENKLAELKEMMEELDLEINEEFKIAKCLEQNLAKLR